MRNAIGALLLLAAAGCTGAQSPPPEPAPVRNRAETPVETQPLAAPDPKPIAKPKPEPKPEIAAATPGPVEPVIDDDPRQFLGLDGHRVAALLGPASFVRRDGAAEVWQYREPACVLDVYLYREANGLSVAHVDLRRRARSNDPPRRCFRALLARQR